MNSAEEKKIDEIINRVVQDPGKCGFKSIPLASKELQLYIEKGFNDWLKDGWDELREEKTK